MISAHPPQLDRGRGLSPGRRIPAVL